MDFAAGETLLFDKPKDWTSFDVVAKVRNLTKAKKVGHAGTLDPLATGLLILCTGRHTKTIEKIQDGDKEYVATVQFGGVTKSYDAEFEPEEPTDASHLTAPEIEAYLPEFTGRIIQTPPAFSAVKVKGQRAYKMARKGKDVAVQPRQITIESLTLENYDPVTWRGTLRIICSKGTYIRSLAHDLGQRLGTGAYLSDLRRTRIGMYSVADAWTIEGFEAWIRTEN
jgi:tRNA pseudouridine55 synthase